MKYLIITVLILASIYTWSYAKFNWDQNNKLGAAGAALLAISEVVAPAIYMLFR